MPHRPLVRLAILCLVALMPLPTFAQFLWVEGTHYKRIESAPPPGTPAGKIAVTEVFSYGCPYCYQALPAINDLKKQVPADAVFNYLHASFVPSEAWPMFQRAYLTADAMGIAEKTHQAMFEAIWKTGELPLVDLATGRLKKPSPTIADAARFYARAAKIREADFLKMASSPKIEALIKTSDDLVRAYQVPGTPALVVNGRYLIVSEAVGSYARISQLITFLVSQERARLKSAAPSAK
jgi:protein dithiol oxidoreductase (disulfide-forming)